MVNVWAEESGKIIAILCGLVINLIINLIANRNILSSTGNKAAYFLIWILSGVFFVLISYFYSVAEQLSYLFYGGVGLSVPQVGLLLMKINDLKKRGNDLKKRVKDLEDSLTKFDTILYIQDIPKAIEDKEKFGCDYVIEKALQRKRYYIKMGILDSEKAEEYVVAIRQSTECFDNTDKLSPQVD